MLKNMKGLSDAAQKAGPYLLLEILLPGGTLFALILLLYRNRSRIARMHRHTQPVGVISELAAKMRVAVLSVQPHDIAAVTNGDAANDADGLGPLAMVPGR